jgi:hypothetical protein
MHGRVFQALACLMVAVAGCSEAPPAAAPSSSPATVFDAARTGTIAGRVVWHGDLPTAPLFDMRTEPPVARGKTCPNPNLPAIDLESRGVANAVIFLRGVDARKSRPWDHPPVRVELRDLNLHIRQGATETRVGFVRTGDAVEMISRDRVLHGVEVRGAAFFSLRFVDPDVSATRRLDRKGVVELSSAMPYHWMRAHLLVDDHPYYVRTDRKGHFELAQVPPGTYQIVCWMPSWHIVRKERDPENSLVNRVVFALPLEVEQPASVEGERRSEVTFRVSSDLFAR